MKAFLKRRGTICRLCLIVILILCFLIPISGCGKKNYTLGDVIIENKIDRYNTIRVFFYGEKDECPDGDNNCCWVIHLVYIDSFWTETGLEPDDSKGGDKHVPCTFTDKTLQLYGFDNYTYKMEQKDKNHGTVIFSKPFLGSSTWEYTIR